jgi:hypothetical protein
VKRRNQLTKGIDPLFDGHVEKPLLDMTVKERLHCVWLKMVFKYGIRNRKIIKNKK